MPGTLHQAPFRLYVRRAGLGASCTCFYPSSGFHAWHAVGAQWVTGWWNKCTKHPHLCSGLGHVTDFSRLLGGGMRNSCERLSTAGTWHTGSARCMPKVIMIVAQLLSRVQLIASPWTVAGQAPVSVGLSRQEYWSE